MNNGDMPASPTQAIEVGCDEHGIPEYMDALGLTKREKFAAMAMQGILSSNYYGEFVDNFTANVNPKAAKETAAAKAALAHADALLEELAKCQP